MSAKSLEKGFSVEKAHRTQVELSKHLILEDELPSTIRCVAGTDVAYTNDLSVAAAALLDFDSLQLKESQLAVQKTVFPYIPTLLSFREIRPTIAAIKKLHTEPEIILVNGHGYAHPYRCGFASHLGLILKKPTIGVAKSLLIGALVKNSQTQDTVFIQDKGEIIGARVRTKSKSKPVYVSVGHMISLETAIRIVKNCVLSTRIPEPIALAHRNAAVEKRRIKMIC